MISWINLILSVIYFFLNKAKIKNSDMIEDMQQDAITVATNAINSINIKNCPMKNQFI